MDAGLGPVRPGLAEAVRFWGLLGFVNFGGPAGQIALMREELVERRRWVDEPRFLHALSFCALLPGPEAHQLAIYVGWLLHGFVGALAAGVLFVAPAAVLMLVLAWTYAAFGEVAWVASTFDGLSAAVVGVVVAAAIALSRTALRTRVAAIAAATTFLAVYVVGLPFPLVVVAALVGGLLLGPDAFGAHAPADELAAPRPSVATTVRTAVIGVAVWLVPLALVAAATGTQSIYAQSGLFYSQVAVITFGGAYAVLAYVGREVIARFGLTSGDVVAGLGLAETTPGPLILVVEFLAFVAGYRDPGSLSPVASGTLAAVVTLWATFVPSFVWVLTGAPWVERLRSVARLTGALAAVTAAVVGIIAGLAVSVATASLFSETVIVEPFLQPIALPRLGTVEPLHLAIAIASFVAIRRFRVHVLWIVVGAAVAGFLASVVR